MANWSIPERKIKIELFAGRTTEKDTKLLSDLDMSYKIEFDIAQAVDGAYPEANFTITGLRVDTLHYLATSYSWFRKDPIFNTIILHAGYKDGNYGKLFEGSIIEAVPDIDTANYSIKLKATPWYKMMTSISDIKSISENGSVSVNKILLDIANQYKLKLMSELPDDMTIVDFNTEDKNFAETIRMLGACANIDITSIDGRLIAKKRGYSLRKLPTLVIDESNMVGSPKPNPIGCDVTIRLNPSVQTGAPVKIKSARFPQLNSVDYYIQTCGHSGDTKGNKWITTLRLVRDDIYKVGYRDVENV